MTTKEPVYRPKICEICHKELPHASRGRPRITCSDRCRQVRRRRYDYLGWRYPRQHDQQWRQAERDLRKIEKVCGRLPDTVGPITSIYDPTISVRERILIRMSRGMDVPKCLVCHKPFITEDGVRGIYCLPDCSELGHNRARTLLTAIGEWEGRYDPRVDVRVRLDLPIKVCPHCTKPFPDYDKRKIYCTPRCRKAHWREEKRRDPQTPRSYPTDGGRSDGHRRDANRHFARRSIEHRNVIMVQRLIACRANDAAPFPSHRRSRRFLPHPRSPPPGSPSAAR